MYVFVPCTVLSFSCPYCLLLLLYFLESKELEWVKERKSLLKDLRDLQKKAEVDVLEAHERIKKTELDAERSAHDLQKNVLLAKEECKHQKSEADNYRSQLEASQTALHSFEERFEALKSESNDRYRSLDNEVFLFTVFRLERDPRHR